MSEKCENCRFWLQWKNALPTYNYGECRINAPVPDVEMEGKWPTTKAAEWCGRFEHRDDRASRLLSTSYMRRSTDEAA